MRIGGTVAFKALAGASAVMFLLPLAAVAGNVTFVDLFDTITLNDDTGRTSGFSCQGEACSLILTGPAGTATSDLNFIAGSWREPGTDNISDQFCKNGCGLSNTFAVILFLSDTEGVLGTCPNCPTENGSVQTSIIITWYNQAGAPIVNDNINLQSGAADVPEPSSILLMFAGTSALGLAIRRRHLA